MSLSNRKSLEPWIPDSIEYYIHQVKGIRKLARMKSFILADDMGLGKTLQALTVFAIDVYQEWHQTMLVVCPATLKENWADEIGEFTTFPYVVLNGPPKVRNEQLLNFMALAGPKILVVNYEQVIAHYDILEAIAFDIVCFDEAHYLKNHKAKRTKACLELFSRRSFLLTGTPMLNHVNELWPLLHRIDPPAYPKYWQFVNRFAVFGGFKDKQIVGVKNEKELHERLQKVQVRRLKKDVLDLPDVQYIERRVDLLPEQKKLYDEVIDELRLPQPDGEMTDIENALTKFLRLKQICGTTFPFTGEDHSSKLDLAIEDSTEFLTNGHKIVVFTQFRDVLSCYANRLDTAIPIWQVHGGIPQSDRQPTVKRWAESKEPGVLVCMLQVAGIGLNMTASRHGQFLDELFVPGLNRQAVDRMHRIGADLTQPVQIWNYICRNTIENRIRQILRVKTKLFGEIVEHDPEWKRKLIAELREQERAA